MAGEEEFFAAAGRSLGDAQDALVGPGGELPTAMAISGADLEVRAAVERRKTGLGIRPIGLADMRAGGIAPELVSTVKVSYVPVPVEGVPAKRKPGEVIEEVRRRPDVERLGRILGDIAFDAEYVSATRRWIVSARDPEDRLLREVVLRDDA